jgi:hypothetical protein
MANMELPDAAGRNAMMRPSTTRDIPTTMMGDILPMVLSSVGVHPNGAGDKTNSSLLRTIYNMNKDHTVKLCNITADRYKRNLQIIFASDMIINTCRSIHARPLGACINLFLAEDIKQAVSVLKRVTYVAPRVPTGQRMATKSGVPYEHTMERVFKSYHFRSDVDIPVAIYNKLVANIRIMERHAEDGMPIDRKQVYLKRMKQELTNDVSRLLVNSQLQMRMGAINVHLSYITSNSASVDMLSAMNDIGTDGEECCLSTALDAVVQKQLDQWLVPEEDHPIAIQDALNVFHEHTSTPTEEGGLKLTVNDGGQHLPVGGIVIISGVESLCVPASQQLATYKRKVRSLDLKEEDYNTDRLMVQPNIAHRAFPQYTVDSDVIVREHNRDDTIEKEEEKQIASVTENQEMLTRLPVALPSGAVLLDNIAPVYIVDKDKPLNPLISTLTHTTQSMWNMMTGYVYKKDITGDFMKSEKMGHVYVDSGSPDLYHNPSGNKLQKISACTIKDAVFNDPYIYSSYFAQCFNTMYKAAMKLSVTNKDRSLFNKCMSTAKTIFKDAHAWHARYRRNRRDFTSTENGDMIMSELHPYFDALPDGQQLKACSRLVHGNIPLYIRPTASVLLAGETLARNIWGHTSYKEHTAELTTSKRLAEQINTFLTGIVPPADQGTTHMLYSVQEQPELSAPNESLPEVSSMYKAEPTSLIHGLCGLPFIFSIGVVTRGSTYKWEDLDSGLKVELDVPQVDPVAYQGGEVGDTCFFHKLADRERGGEVTFRYMVRPAFHELMKEIRASTACFAVKMCAMFCAWIRLTAEGTEFAFNHTHWPFAATVLSFKKDDTKHVLVSRPNTVISLADVPKTEIVTCDDKITIQSTAHYRVACDGINSNSVIALHALGVGRTKTFSMTVSTPPDQIKDIKIPATTTHAFTGYKKLVDLHHAANSRKRTHTGQQIISLSGEQIAWLCPPVVPDSAFQRPTNPTGRSSLPRTSDTPLVDASVEMHDPSKDNGTGVSTLNPYATLPGGYVFCLHADPNGKVGDVNNCTYRRSRGASRAAHFFAPPQLMTKNNCMSSPSMAKKLCNLPTSRRLMGDQKKFPVFLDGDSCNSSMSSWSEATGLAQHEPHASNALIYANMISNRQSDSTYAARDVDWHNQHYAVLGHTFYAKNKSYASHVVSPV